MIKTEFKDHECGKLRLEDIDKTVTLSGWVATVRDLGGILFIELRDRSGVFQLVANPQINPQVHEVFGKVRSEYVIKVTGKITKRPPETYNEKYPTGQVEMYPDSVEILSESKVLPFVLDDENVSEDIRLKYRYLDLRRESMLSKLVLRHNIVTAIRNYMNGLDFLEVETPILIKTTPEGARDYLVPSRVQEGKFFALPQSPQIFKQLLMVGGIERYYQIAKCFRDEDLRADRQPEFTQVDIEMSFVKQQDVIKVVEGLIVDAFKAAGVEVKPPFTQISWQEAMDRFGSDKPDTRFGFELKDISDLVKDCGFSVFSGAIANGGTVRGINITGQGSMPRKKIDALVDFAKGYGAKGLAYIAINEDGSFKSSFAKFMTEDEMKNITDRLEGKPGDLLLFAADRAKIVYAVLGALRCEMAERLGLLDKNTFNFLWITEFPLFEYSDEEQRFVAMHHPFTMPMEEDVEYIESDPGRCRAKAYDIVLNGTEIGGGSVRICSGLLDLQMKRLMRNLDSSSTHSNMEYLLTQDLHMVLTDL